MKLSLVGLAAALPLALAHAARRSEGSAKLSKPSLARCEPHIQRDGVFFARAAEQRANLLRAAAGRTGVILGRDNIGSVLNRSHEVNAKANHIGVVLSGDSEHLMALRHNGSNGCVLTPQETEGPYYIAGEAVRMDLRDDQPGVEMYLDLQVIDVNTCQPMPDVYVEIWHANATGFYSGVDTAASPANVNTTFARGIQQTGPDGGVYFQTIFPGHYPGRSTHIHVATHRPDSVVVFPNGTIVNTHVTLAAQLYFDDALTAAIEARIPYADNPDLEGRVRNRYDSGFLEAAQSTDPVLSYAWLTANSLVAWMPLGIDVTYRREIIAAGRADVIPADAGEMGPNV